MTGKIYRGVFAAAVTPLNTDFSPDIDAIPIFLSFLAQRGCHGALILGTTGEGPSFAFEERKTIYQAANEVKKIHPDFILLAGTGSPSLQETINFTQLAFDLGLDGVVVLPPYYYKNVTEEGLFLWFSDVLDRAVPSDGVFFGYHIPQITNVSLSIDLLKRLKDEYPDQFKGVKNSSADPSFAIELGKSFGDDLTVFTGNDRLFSLSLKANASGCITALANLVSPELRTVWDAFHNGGSILEVQESLNLTRTIFDRYPPAAAVIKSMLSLCHDLPKWNVRQPLIPLPEDLEQQILVELGWVCD